MIYDKEAEEAAKAEKAAEAAESKKAEKAKKGEEEEEGGKLTLCLNSCYVGKRFYKKGESYVIDEGAEYAKHFKIPDTARKKLEKAAAEAKAAAKK